MLLASPLAIVVSMTRASRSGIQVKAGPFVEASARLDTVVFDKTGTLTTGKFVVSGVRTTEKLEARSQKFGEEELLKVAVTIEQRREALRGDVEIDDEGVVDAGHGDRPDLVGGTHDLLAEREADREVLEVGRSREHHDVVDALVPELDRALFRDLVGHALEPPGRPALDRHGRDGGAPGFGWGRRWGRQGIPLEAIGVAALLGRPRKTGG